MTKTQTNAMIPQIINALEKAAYVAKGPEDIAALTAASRIGDQVPGTYLRVLLAGVQVKSGMDVRTSALRGKPPVVEDVAADLTLINEVHQDYYAVVLKTITTDDIADEKGLRRAEAKRRAQERNKRSNFARGAKSTLVKFVKAGGNFRALCVLSVTKQQLRGFILQTQRATQEVTPQQEAIRNSSRIVRIIEQIREENEALAQLTARDAIAKLADMFDIKTTTSAAKAVEQGIMLKVGGSRFWPASAEPHMTQ